MKKHKRGRSPLKSGHYALPTFSRSLDVLVFFDAIRMRFVASVEDAIATQKRSETIGIFSAMRASAFPANNTDTPCFYLCHDGINI